MSDQTAQRPTIISRKWLDDRGACREQAQLFERVWPDGVTVTRETLELSAKKGLSLEWFAEQVLPRSDYAAFQSQRDTLGLACLAHLGTLHVAYEAQLRTLHADYDAQFDTLEAACPTHRAALDADYKAQCVALSAANFAAFQAQRIPMEAAYQAQRDTLLINAVCNLCGADAPALPESSCATEAGNE